MTGGEYMKGTPERRPQGRPRRPETEEAILRAAQNQLATEGYARMSVESIAAEAGTTKPTIYRRWPTKADLAVEALARLQAAELPEPTGSLRTDLIAALRDFQKKLLRPNGMAMIGTVLAEEGHTPGLIGAFRRHIVAPRRSHLRAILEAAQLRSELREHADLDAAVNMLVGSYYARYLTGEGIPRDWAERIVETLLHNMEASRSANKGLCVR